MGAASLAVTLLSSCTCFLTRCPSREYSSIHMHKRGMLWNFRIPKDFRSPEGSFRSPQTISIVQISLRETYLD